jgi:hypothetical protein
LDGGKKERTGQDAGASDPGAVEAPQARRLWLHCGEYKRFFEPFIYINGHFTKTGSGQT